MGKMGKSMVKLVKSDRNRKWCLKLRFFFKGIGLIFRWGWWDFSPNDSTATTLGESIDWGGKMKPLWAWKQDEGSFWLLGFPARLFWEYWKIDQPDLRWQCSSLLGLSEIPQWCSQGLRPLAKPCQKGQGAQSVLSVRNPPGDSHWFTMQTSHACCNYSHGSSDECRFGTGKASLWGCQRGGHLQATGWWL